MKLLYIGRYQFIQKADGVYTLPAYGNAFWQKFHFNALFHGDDWKGSPMYEQAQTAFKKVGVSAVFLPHTDGISSTLLRKKLQEK